mmetsp:Transcript_34910/g.109146  ORF Transcript_34910/g.109146 Transcript_34910/m.109146 type:complete len:226 (-) Transcript_34910:23-700(-)
MEHADSKNNLKPSSNPGLILQLRDVNQADLPMVYSFPILRHSDEFDTNAGPLYKVLLYPKDQPFLPLGGDRSSNDLGIRRYGLYSRSYERNSATTVGQRIPRKERYFTSLNTSYRNLTRSTRLFRARCFVSRRILRLFAHFPFLRRLIGFFGVRNFLVKQLDLVQNRPLRGRVGRNVARFPRLELLIFLMSLHHAVLRIFGCKLFQKEGTPLLALSLPPPWLPLE